MATGWPLRPNHLSDRVDESNNILFETCTTNFIKWHYQESHYPSIRALIASIRVPDQYANARLEIGPYDASLELDLGSARPGNCGDGDDLDEDEEDDLEPLSDMDAADEEEGGDEEIEC